MRPIHRVVFSVDFSERSRGAAKYAKILARQFHADLTLLHVLSAGGAHAGGIEMSAAFTEDWHNMLWKEKKSQLDSSRRMSSMAFPPSV